MEAQFKRELKQINTRDTKPFICNIYFANQIETKIHFFSQTKIHRTTELNQRLNICSENKHEQKLNPIKQLQDRYQKVKKKKTHIHKSVIIARKTKHTYQIS
jgi:hypothetical protein